MPVSDMLMSGFQLMLLGMGIVFGFLILLVFVLKLMSWVACKIATDDPLPTASAPRAVPAAVDDKLLAVISAAVTRYRAGRGR